MDTNDGKATFENDNDDYTQNENEEINAVDADNSINDGSSDNDKDTKNTETSSITIRLPNANTEQDLSFVKNEPNYVAVVTNEIRKSVSSTKHRNLEQYQKQSNILSNHNDELTMSNGYDQNNKQSFSRASSPEYTQLILTKHHIVNVPVNDNVSPNKNQQILNDDNDENDEYTHKKYANQLSKQSKNYSRQIISLELNNEQIIQQQHEQEQASYHHPYHHIHHKQLNYYNRQYTDNIVNRTPHEANELKTKSFIQIHNRRTHTAPGLNDSDTDSMSKQEIYTLESLRPELRYKKRNLLVERRNAIRRTLIHSRGLMPINTPVEDSERSTNFVFAVANENALTQIGYNSDLEDTNKAPVVATLVEEISKSKSEAHSRAYMRAKSHMKRSQSSKTKSDASHSTITFLYKDKDLFNEDDILNYDKSKFFDMYGPGPTSYHVPRRPPNERISPSYTFGQRCFIEKKGGGRTSWEKEWFSSKNPFLYKNDFKRDKRWPTPHDYAKKPGIGDKNQATWYQYPVYTMASRLNNNNTNNNDENKNKNLPLINASKITTTSSINSFDANERVAEFILKPTNKEYKEKDPTSTLIRDKKAKITIKSRPNGTVLWPKKEITPSPAAYDHTKFTNIKPSRPSFSITNTCPVNYTGGRYAVI